MKKVYLVCQDDYSKTPLFATDSYNDALHFAASLSDSRTDTKDLVKSMPFLTNAPVKLDPSNLDAVVDHTIKATLKAFEAVSGNEASTDAAN